MGESWEFLKQIKHQRDSHLIAFQVCNPTFAKTFLPVVPNMEGDPFLVFSSKTFDNAVIVAIMICPEFMSIIPRTADQINFLDAVGFRRTAGSGSAKDAKTTAGCAGDLVLDERR